MELKLNNPLETLSFSPTINLGEGKEVGNELWAVTNLEVYIFFFNITDPNDSFFNSTPGQWEEGGKETIERIKEFSEHRPQNDFQLQGQEAQKGTYFVYLDEAVDYNDKGSDLIQAFGMYECKNDTYKRLKGKKDYGLEDIVYGMNSTFNGVVDSKDKKVIVSTTKNTILLPEI